MISGIGLDWLQGHLPAACYREIWSLLDLHTQKTAVEEKSYLRGRVEWRRFVWLKGWELHIQLNEAGEPVDHLQLVLKGEAFPVFNSAEVLQGFLENLRRLEFDAYRIDIRFDDFKRVVSARNVWEHCEAGLYSGPKFRFVTQERGGGVYFGKKGSEGSGIEHVVYDKSAESDGAIESIRWESRAWRKKAPDWWDYLVPVAMGELAPISVAEFVTRMGSLVFGGVEFYTSTDEKNCDRREIPAWWREIRSTLGRGVTFLGCEETPRGSRGA